MKEENAKTITRFKNKNNIMEITVNIPKNDYVQPTEVRQEVVQYICDAFLSTSVWRIFHPERQSAYRGKTLYVMVSKRSGKAYGFGGYAASDSDVNIRFNGEEMKAAFKALRNAGYHMFLIYEYGLWKGYICDKKPFIQDGEEVTTFNDFID